MNIDKYFDNLEFLKKIGNNDYEIDNYDIDILSKIIVEGEVFNNLNIFSNFCECTINTIHALKSNSSNLDTLKLNLRNACKNLREKALKRTYFNIYYSETDLLDFNKIILKNNNINILKKINDKSKSNSNALVNVRIGFLSKEEHINNPDSNFDIVIYIDDLYDDLTSVFMRNFIINKKSFYEYNYLLNSINKYKESTNPNVILGNSYCRTGFNENLISDNTFNLSLGNQDIYYSFKLLLHLIKIKKPDKVFLSISDFMLYQDNTLSENITFKYLVKNVYYPILKDKRNFKHDLNEDTKYDCVCSNDTLLQHIIHSNNLKDYLYKKLLQNKNFYNELRPQTITATLHGLKAHELDTYMKRYFCQERVSSHTKVKKYIKSKDENVRILEEFISTCNNLGIDLILIKFPTSSYYKERCCMDLQNEVHDLIHEFSKVYTFDFIKLEEIENFNDYDFIDFDHLSEAGSVKSTKAIYNYLNYKNQK